MGEDVTPRLVARRVIVLSLLLIGGIMPIAFRAPSASASSMPALSIGDASVVEGDVGTHSVAFSVTLSEPSSSTVTVDYQLAGVNATPNVDFNNRSGALRR